MRIYARAIQPSHSGEVLRCLDDQAIPIPFTDSSPLHTIGPNMQGTSGTPAGVVAADVTSEYGILEAVLVHEPGEEIDRLTISNREHLLFEDIPFLRDMRREHQQFVRVLEENGVRVLKLEDMLADLLKDPGILARLVRRAATADHNPGLAAIILDHYSPEQIQGLLFAGLTSKELSASTGVRLDSSGSLDDPFLLTPMPNAYFTRDPAAVIGNAVVSCKMHYVPRVRESLIMRELLSHHPAFTGIDFVYGNMAEDEYHEERPFTVEGGDIIVLHSGAVAVGQSERTRSQSIMRLAENLFRHTAVERVYEIRIPARREYMHLDTVFTIVDSGLVVAYPGVMDHVTEIVRYEPLYVQTSEGEKLVAWAQSEARPFNAVLQDEFDGQLAVIPTGDGNLRYAEREQRSDGTNVFAIAPKKVITYDRNTATNAALRRHGVDVIEIPGSELVRGLGGPRCMTMPIRRSKGNAGVSHESN